ncbi:MAG: multicopper oxidase domain-containing protein [Piscinibacter sp.]
MKLTKLLAALATALALPAAQAGVYAQCPDDVKAQGTTVTDPVTGLRMRILEPAVSGLDHRKVCMHITGGDGWQVLGDGTPVYGFGFAPAEGEGDEVMSNGEANANFPAPTITLREGDEIWLSLSNVGMIFRPDLFDSHSVHWHGYPNASAIFDGVPQGSVTVNPGSTITYYYKANDAGTFMYHCHVEATEHMEMGMLGMLNVLPRQDGTSVGGFTQFAYNDGDGSTGYHTSSSIQLGSVDRTFHELHAAVQPLPFLELKGDYGQINGRGYPMTTFENQADMPQAPDSPSLSQKVNAVVRARAGDRVLLHMTNLSIDAYYTVTALGLPMQVVGRGAQIARGPGGASWAHGTASVTLGGGDGQDILIDTTGIEPGTYYLYTTNLNFLSNGEREDRGGLMTTIVLQ